MNFLKKLLYVEDSPDSTYNRRWRYWPSIYRYGSNFSIGIDLQLIQFKGVTYDDWVVGTNSVQFECNPLKWKIAQTHMYYDGCHCIYQFGPFAFYRGMDHECNKCLGEE